MNRAQRRKQVRDGASYDKRKTFSKQELEDMNITAYNLGVKHTLEAAWLELGIGEKRQKRIVTRLEWLQRLDFDKSWRK